MSSAAVMVAVAGGGVKTGNKAVQLSPRRGIEEAVSRIHLVVQARCLYHQILIVP
jgi:CO dehydrogenase/acetyl-CoA synthase gamma subunit (corrinoid Fe-S protein)